MNVEHCGASMNEVAPRRRHWNLVSLSCIWSLATPLSRYRSRLLLSGVSSAFLSLPLCQRHSSMSRTIFNFKHTLTSLHISPTLYFSDLSWTNCTILLATLIKAHWPIPACIFGHWEMFSLCVWHMCTGMNVFSRVLCQSHIRRLH